MLFVNQQTDFVTQIELIASGDTGNETNRIETHDFDVQQVAPKHVRIGRELQSDRAMVARVRTAQKHAPPVQAKVPVLKDEIPEPAAHTRFIQRLRLATDTVAP